MGAFHNSPENTAGCFCGRVGIGGAESRLEERIRLGLVGMLLSNEVEGISKNFQIQVLESRKKKSQQLDLIREREREI